MGQCRHRVWRPSGRGSASCSPLTRRIAIKPIRAESGDIPGSATRMGSTWLPQLPRAWDGASAEFRARAAKDRRFAPRRLLKLRFGPKARVSRDLLLGWVPYDFTTFHVLGTARAPGSEPIRTRIGILFANDSLNYNRTDSGRGKDIAGFVTRTGVVWHQYLPRTSDSAGTEFRAHPAKDRRLAPRGLLKLQLDRFGPKAKISPGSVTRTGFIWLLRPTTYLG